MSVCSWQRKFYKTPADKAAGSDREAVRHSILKWTGLLKRNLAKHDVSYSDRKVFIDDSYDIPFHINGRSCALCHRYSDAGPDEEMNVIQDCYNKKLEMYCPIVRATGKSCDFGLKSAWNQSKDRPEPMLELLKLTYKTVIGNGNSCSSSIRKPILKSTLVKNGN